MVFFQRKGQDCCASFSKRKPSFSLSVQIYQGKSTGARTASLATLATRSASPRQQSIRSCGLEMFVLGLIFVASLAQRDHRQHKGKFQKLSKGLHMNPCARSALPCSRELLQYRRDCKVLAAPPASRPKGRSQQASTKAQIRAARTCRAGSPNGLPKWEREPEMAS